MPVEALFSDLCQSDAERLPDGLCLEALFGFVVVRFTSVAIAQAVAYGHVEL